MSIPMDTASKGDLPVKYLEGSYPITDKLAASEPGGTPSGMVATVPTCPIDANRFMTGREATSKGVFPPRFSMGSSPAPSGTNIKYFIFHLRFLVMFIDSNPTLISLSYCFRRLFIPGLHRI
jgi:hypothetical protein